MTMIEKSIFEAEDAMPNKHEFISVLIHKLHPKLTFPEELIVNQGDAFEWGSQMYFVVKGSF